MRCFLEVAVRFMTDKLLLNIVLLKSSQAQNTPAVHQRDFGNVRQAKQIRSTQVYEKW